MVDLLGVARSVTGDEPKCVDCAYHRLIPPDPVLIYSWPKHRCAAAIDLVTGKTIETDCYAMRHRWVECGPDAKLFEPAPPVDLPSPPSPAPPDPVRSMGLIPLLVGLVVLAILVALVYRAYEQDQPRVIQTGVVSVKKVSVKDGSCCVTARTRLLAKGGRSLWQFEASQGGWEDCGDDCEKALRRKLAR